MKKLIQPIIIAGLIILLFLKSCGNEKSEPQIIEVEVPAQSGEFEPQTPKVITKTDTFYKIKWKEVEVEVPNPVNSDLLEKYETAKDSLERYKMYVDAIQIKYFESYFEDEYLSLTVTGKVQGEIKSIKPKYTIKTRTTETTIAPEQTVFRLLGGVEFGNNTSLNDFRYKFNLGFQNAKGNVISASYEKWNGVDYYWIGYDFSIFSIEK